MVNHMEPQKANEKCKSRKKVSICMISDFFYPRLGGVETHIYQLSQSLLLRGFKVIVLTHYRGTRQGIRYMANGLKVYYLPSFPFIGPVIFPCLFTVAPLFRQIIKRERIDVLHLHQATSVLSLQCLVHAKTTKTKVVYTEHSIYDMDDFAGIHVTEVQSCFLSHLDHVITVSHKAKENYVTRNSVDPQFVSTINNAVDTTKLVPDTGKRPKAPTINIVAMHRLTYRKGVDLLVQLIPRVCKAHKNVVFTIGGDGNMRSLLEEMRDLFELGEQVQLLGAIPHDKVYEILQTGHVFLSCSLSEAFCIAIAEAAACGLTVVATNVGGVPEVLPQDLLILAEPNVDALYQGIVKAISQKVDPLALHEKVTKMYSWHDVASRMQRVYEHVLEQPETSAVEAFYTCYKRGHVIEKFFGIFMLLDYWVQTFFGWLYKNVVFDDAVDFPLEGLVSTMTKNCGEESI